MILSRINRNVLNSRIRHGCSHVRLNDVSNLSSYKKLAESGYSLADRLLNNVVSNLAFFKPNNVDTINQDFYSNLLNIFGKVNSAAYRQNPPQMKFHLTGTLQNQQNQFNNHANGYRYLIAHQPAIGQKRNMSTNAAFAHRFKEVDGPKSIVLTLDKLEKELKARNAKSIHLAELQELKVQLIKETQQIHLEAMLFKLIKKAATKTNSTAEALEMVRNSPGIKNQPQAQWELKRLSNFFMPININHLRSMDVEKCLQLIQMPKQKFTSGLVDANTIRKNAVHSSANDNRIDKENTGLKNTIIVFQDGSLVALKNSVELRNKQDSKTLKNMLMRKADDNYDFLDARIIDSKKTHMHPQKLGCIKALLGQGAFGKVRPGEDMLTGEYSAVKKMDSITFAEREIEQKEKLFQALKNNSSDLKYFLIPDSIAISHGKNGNDKAYLRSKLQGDDGLEEVKKLHKLKSEKGQLEFEKSHKEFILKTMETVEVLNRNDMVHGDLKWPNIVGGKIADIDGICYQYGDPIGVAETGHLSPELTLDWRHPSKESYDKHTSFALGRMLLESIDLDAESIFPLKGVPITDEPDALLRPAHGYSKDTPVPTYNSSGKPFTAYEKNVIKLAYQLADTNPANRPMIAEAKKVLGSQI